MSFFDVFFEFGRFFVIFDPVFDSFGPSQRRNLLEWRLSVWTRLETLYEELGLGVVFRSLKKPC